MATLYAGWTETQEEANTRWAWKQQRELCARIVETAKPVMDAMLATISLIDEPHPADVASDLEATPLAEQVTAEVQSDNQWLDSAPVRRDKYSITLSDIERSNAMVKADIYTRDPNCQHERAFPTYGGMMCRCGAKFEARNEFEQRLVNSRNPKGNGYVNYQFR